MLKDRKESRENEDLEREGLSLSAELRRTIHGF
jgi:hypothetical protein